MSTRSWGLDGGPGSDVVGKRSNVKHWATELCRSGSVWPPLERPPSPRATAGGAEGASPTGAAAAAAVGNAADGVAATLSSLLPAAEGRKEQQAASAQLPQPGAAAASDTTTGGAVAASNAAGDEVRSAAADGVGTVPPEAAARSPADSEETRDSQDGAPGMHLHLLR